MGVRLEHRLSGGIRFAPAPEDLSYPAYRQCDCMERDRFSRFRVRFRIAPG